MSTKTDLFTSKEIRLWYCLQSNGCHDLYYTRREDTCAIGSIPKWWDNDPEDLSTILGIDEFSNANAVEIEGLTFRYPWLYWALCNGIAPGQSFQIAFSEPTYTRTSWEYDEWDAEWDGFVCQIEPWPTSYIVRRWSSFLTKLERQRLFAVREYKELERSVMKNTGAMVIQQSSYTPNNGPMYKGVRLSLNSTLRKTHASASGKYVCTQWGTGFNDSGNLNVAMAQLVKEACASNSFLCPEVIYSMEVKHT